MIQLNINKLICYASNHLESIEYQLVCIYFELHNCSQY